MPITYVEGDPLLTQAQVLAFGHNRKGRIELGLMETELMQAFPAAFSGYRRQCKKGRIATGDYWLWRENKPMLMFMTIRESSVGATRLRYVQAIAMKLAREYFLEGLHSIAITPLGEPAEWPEIKMVFETWLTRSKLPVIIYDRYLPGVQVDESSNITSDQQG